MRMQSPYDNRWEDFSCTSPYMGICQFYPNGPPVPQKPTLPAKNGCKPGWWAFAGYCYKEYGLGDADASDTTAFKNYYQANDAVFYRTYPLLYTNLRIS